MRLLSSCVRSSCSPLPIERQIGMPTGQPNSAVFKSSPMRLRSSCGIPFNQSRTGSPPLAVRKKIAGTLFIAHLGQTTWVWCTA